MREKKEEKSGIAVAEEKKEKDDNAGKGATNRSSHYMEGKERRAPDGRCPARRGETGRRQKKIFEVGLAGAAN